MHSISSRPIRAVTSAAAFAVVAMAAHAQDAQPARYAGLHGGVNNLHGWSANVDFGGGVSMPGQLALSRGSHFGVFGGRQTENARFEAEYQHGRFGIDRIELGPVGQAMSASGHYDAATFNAYRTQAITQRLNAYGALGLGWGRVSLPQMGFAEGCNCFPASSKSGFAWLARAGLEYDFDGKHKAFVQYTLLGLPRPGSSTSPGVEYSRKTVGAASLGYRLAF